MYLLPLFSLALLLVTSPVGAYDVTHHLAWTDNSDDENGFRIERQTGRTGTFTQIGETIVGVINFVDIVPYGTVVCYRVRAFNDDGNSAYTSTVCAGTSIWGSTNFGVGSTWSGTGTWGGSAW